MPGSKSWDTACPRICTWVRLTDKVTGRTFCFANTHTDHNSELARTEGMKLIMKRMREFAPGGMPVVFTGDHYVSKGVRVKSHVCHSDTRPGTKLYPSDHFPLSAEIELPPRKGKRK